MKIVHLVEELGIGGLPNYVLDLARLQKTVFENATVVHLGDAAGSTLNTGGVDIARAETIADIAALNPDIIHVHLLSRLDFLQGLFSLRIPLIRSFHDYTSTCLRRGKRRWPGDRCQRPLGAGCAACGCVIGPPPAGTRLPRLMNLPAKITERGIYRRFDAAITGSGHMTGMLLKNGFESPRVHTIPYFSRFAGQASQSVLKAPGAGKDRPLEMLFAGQAVSGKGLEILIEALAGLEGSWRLTTFGEGPRLTPAKMLAQKLNLSDKISFRGWAPQAALAEAYASADLFVLPSIWDDPGPLVGIEALSFAAPVAGFAVGGIPDYVIDGKTGFLVKDISSRGLKKCLQACLADPEKLASMGPAGQKLILGTRTPATHLAALRAIYESCLQGGRRFAAS